MNRIERIEALAAILRNTSSDIPLELSHVGKGLADLLRTESPATLAGDLAAVHGSYSDIPDRLVAFGGLICMLTDGPGPLGPDYELPGTPEEWEAILTWVASHETAAASLPTVIELGYSDGDDTFIRDATGAPELSNAIGELLELLSDGAVDVDEPATFREFLTGITVDKRRADEAVELYGNMQQWWGSKIEYALLSTVEGVYELRLVFDGSSPGTGDVFGYLLGKEERMAELRSSFRTLANNAELVLHSLRERAAEIEEEE